MRPFPDLQEPAMWRLDTPWFTVALVMTIFAVGGVIFGRFEQHKPRWRRVLKQVLVLAVFVLADRLGGRSWVYGLLGVFALAAVVVHAWWLPKHGISGWTAEPYDRYLALIQGKQRGRNS
jgi:hypothetical protein